VVRIYRSRNLNVNDLLIVKREMTSFLDARKHDPKMVCIVRRGIKLKKSELYGLCVNAVIECYKKSIATRPDRVGAWRLNGQPKIVLRTTGTESQEIKTYMELAQQAGLAYATAEAEINAGSKSPVILVLGPAEKVLIDSISGKLRLLQ